MTGTRPGNNRPEEPTIMLLEEVGASFYDAALEPGKWDRALAALRSLFAASLASISWVDDRLYSHRSFHSGVDRAVVEEYNQRYYSLDIVYQRLLRSPFGVFYGRERLIDDDTLVHSSFYREFMSPNGFFHAAMAVCASGGGNRAIIALGRTRDDGPFTPEEVSEINRLMPHFSRAAQVDAALTATERRSQAFQAALDAMAQGVVLFDEGGAVLHANPAAQSVLRTAGIAAVPGRHLPATAVENGRLAQLVADVVRDDVASAGGIVIAGEELSIAAHAARLDGRALAETAGGPVPGAALFVAETRRRPLDGVAGFAALHHLTPMEARTVACVVGGLTPAETAAELGIGMATARFHLAGVFAKTGARNQADLVRLYFMSAGWLAPGARPVSATTA